MSATQIAKNLLRTAPAPRHAAQPSNSWSKIQDDGVFRWRSDKVRTGEASAQILPILQWKTTVSRVLGVEGYSTYFYILAFFKAKWLTAHGTRQLQIFQVAYARFPDKA